MATKITKIIGPFRTVDTPHFEKGKARDIEFTIYPGPPAYIEIRAMGIPERYHVNLGGILRMGAEQEIRHRIKRGAI
jgi:hypothetical protein